LIFVENVPGIHDGSHLNWEFSRFRQAIEKLKYSVDCKVILSQDYGIPQRRKRLILIASRIGLIEFPRKTHVPATASPEYASVRQWIGDLPPIAAGQEHLEVQNHRAALLSPLNLYRIRSTPEGGGWKDWPEDLRPACHRGDFTGYTDVYGRMKWDSPASGLTTRCISYSNGRFGHQSQHRAISVREAASLQTFPLDFTFTGNLNSMAKQVGNAVPVLLAKHFGDNFQEHVARTFQTT
jgi:DNA (cytosine-5)-methyltransferase 1